MYPLYTFLLILHVCARRLSNSFNDGLDAYTHTHTHTRTLIDLRKTISSNRQLRKLENFPKWRGKSPFKVKLFSSCFLYLLYATSQVYSSMKILNMIRHIEA